MTLKTRIAALEAEHDDDHEVTLEEWILWSERPEEFRRGNSPENLEFHRRFERSSLGKMIAKVVESQHK